MKTTSAVLAILFAQSANAFCPGASAPIVSALSASTGTEEIAKTLMEDKFKYETSVNTDQKFKVKDMDVDVLDPKKRVQP
jgi:hypothetical protein